MKFILLMFTRSHKKQKTARKQHLFQITVRSTWRTPSKSVWSMMMNMLVKLSCVTVMHLETLGKYIWQKGIGQIQGNPTAKTFLWPEMCPTLLSKVSLNSSCLFINSVYGSWDLPYPHFLDISSLKSDRFLVVWTEISNHADWMRLMISTASTHILLAVSRKKLLVAQDLWLVQLGTNILWAFTQSCQCWKNVTWKFKGSACKSDGDAGCR